jgi:hypothetical protein
VKAIESQPFGRELVHRRRWHTAAEGAELAEPGIIDQDQYDVRGALWCLHRLRKLRGVGIAVSASDVTGEMKVGPREHAGCCGRSEFTFILR